MFKMLFCPKCGSILKPSRVKGELECSTCKFKIKPAKGARVSEVIKKKSKKVEVVEQDIEVLPKTKEECPKCKHHEAYYWTQQTRAADEAATKFLKCTKCGYTWRDYT